MATQNEKLEVLRKREAQIKAQIALAEATEKAKRRKEDTRVKVLIGAAFVADTDQNPETRPGVMAILDRAIVAPKDRAFLKSQGWL